MERISKGLSASSFARGRLSTVGVLACVASLVLLASPQAHAACSEPQYAVSRYSDSIPTHYNVYRGCATRAEAEAACAEFSRPYMPYYESPGCNWSKDAQGRRLGWAGHYRLVKGLPFYYLKVYYVIEGPVASGRRPAVEEDPAGKRPTKDVLP